MELEQYPLQAPHLVRGCSAAGLEEDRGWVLQRLSALLDAAHRRLKGGNSRQAFRLLGAPLSALRDEAEALGSDDEFATCAHRHPLFGVVQQDPYTRRAFEKPRGYAGDAVMLDLVYDGVPPPDTTLTGRLCFFSTTRGPMGLSVLHRRSMLRACIDHAVASSDDFQILSVACGHCRELEGSLFMETPCRGTFVALDQDGEACQRVRDLYQGFPVRVEEGQVRALLAGARDLGAFDLIYTGSLLDSLATPLASHLTRRLMEMLRPGGRLVLSNFVPECDGSGYMAAMMDWPLTLRGEAGLRALFPESASGKIRTHLDPHGNVAYAEFRRECP